MGNTIAQSRSTASMDLEIQNLKNNNAILKKHLDNANGLITRCKNWVGTDLGRDIADHIAAINGTRVNPNDWDFSDHNGEQGR